VWLKASVAGEKVWLPKVWLSAKVRLAVTSEPMGELNFSSNHKVGKPRNLSRKNISQTF
jgi:hypothetical protein